MKYFRAQNNEVFGYDETYSNDLPYIKAAINNGWEDISDSWPPKISSSEALTAECKNKAKQLLLDTDYTQFADVSETLKNKKEFDSYRSTVRELFLKPVPDPQWPIQPNPIWLKK